MTDQRGYDSAYGEWRSDPLAWWERAAEDITWDRRWDQVFDNSRGVYGHWFTGGMPNTCFNCADRQTETGWAITASLRGAGHLPTQTDASVLPVIQKLLHPALFFESMSHWEKGA